LRVIHIVSRMEKLSPFNAGLRFVIMVISVAEFLVMY